MKRKKIIRRVLFGILSICMLSIFLTAAGIDNTAYDSSYIEDDLFGSIIDNKVFDKMTYGKDESLLMRPIYLSEFCFSENLNGMGNFSLYIYIYNPQDKHIDINSNLNMVQLATNYNDKGDPNSYKKYRLKYCTRTKDNMLYKFKIVDKKNEILNRVLKTLPVFSGRKYDVSGIEIQEFGKNIAEEYKFGCQYLYTGYARGYGLNNKESTLNVKVGDMETITLNVNNTNYLTGISSTGAHHRNNISSVYFAIPNNLIDTYGYLNKISAQWYEYFLKPIIVTCNHKFYEKLNDYTHHELVDNQSNNEYSLYYGFNKAITSNPETIILPNGTTVQIKGPNEKWSYDWAYSINNSTGVKIDGGQYVQNVNSKGYSLPLVFFSERLDDKSIFSDLNKKTIAGNVNSDILTNYIYGYDKDIKENIELISEQLIEKELDVIRKSKYGIKRGFNQITAELSDSYNLQSYKSNHNLFERLQDYGFIRPDNIGYDDIEFDAIQKVNRNDLVNDNGNSLLINSKDYLQFKEYCMQAYANNSTPYLFRFAVSDYYSRPLGRVSRIEGVQSCDEKGSDTYLAKQTIFLNFDIIELTFMKSGEYTSIPAISSPLDIVAGVVPPPIEYTITELGIGKIKNAFNNIGIKIANWWRDNQNILMPIIIVLFIILICCFAMLVYRIINKLCKDKQSSTDINNKIIIEVDDVRKNDNDNKQENIKESDGDIEFNVGQIDDKQNADDLKEDK